MTSHRDRSYGPNFTTAPGRGVPDGAVVRMVGRAIDEVMSLTVCSAEDALSTLKDIAHSKDVTLEAQAAIVVG